MYICRILLIQLLGCHIEIKGCVIVLFCRNFVGWWIIGFVINKSPEMLLGRATSSDNAALIDTFSSLLSFPQHFRGHVHFLSPDQQSGIHCLIICAIQLLTPNNLGETWRHICSPDIRNVSALEVLRNRALQIDMYLLTYLLTYVLSSQNFDYMTPRWNALNMG